MLNKYLLIIIILTLLCGCRFDYEGRKIPEPTTNKDKFIEQIKDVVCEDEDRLKSVVELYKRMGVDESEISIEEFENVKNVVLTVEGKTTETVVVGGHYDKTTLGCGAIDNWTGIVIIANLYDNFKNESHDFENRKNEKTYKFVAFGKEEKGLIGSQAMVDKIPENERNKYCAMVNFDSFGFTDVWNLESISDNDLIDLAEYIALKRGFTHESKNFKGASSDSKSFLHNNIPAITFSGLDDDWRDYLHQEKDQLENINFDKVFDNFLFTFDYLHELDFRPCDFAR